MSKDKTEKALLTTLALGAGAALVRSSKGLIAKFADMTFTHTVDLTVLHWNIRPEVILKYFNNLGMGLSTRDRSRKVKIEDALEPIYGVLSERSDWTIFNGSMIVVSATNTPNDRGGSTDKFKMSCLNRTRDIHNMHVLIRQMLRESRIETNRQAQDEWVEYCGRHMRTGAGRPVREFDKDVFLPEAQVQELINSIKKFAGSEEWYSEHKIPYHYGILLYGPPGTGKSSIIQAITNVIPSDVWIVPVHLLGQVLDEDNGSLMNDNRDPERLRFIIIEDIDRSVFSSKPSISTTEGGEIEKDLSTLLRNDSKAAIGKLMNMMDGYASPDGIIYIFTTNHVDQLDPALIRPGRIDLKLEIGYVCDETFAKFMKHHYPDFEIPEGYRVRDCLTFAELQTKVMLGWTAETMLQYCEGCSLIDAALFRYGRPD